MTKQEQNAFRDYLRTIEDELLGAVTADYIWLASQSEDENGQPDSRFHWRRGACHDECLRRGKSRIWRRAERELAGAVRQVA